MQGHTNSLSLQKKIGQLFFVGIAGPDIDEQTADLLLGIEPGGVCLFSRNIKTAEQTRRLLDDIRQRSEIEPFLSLDQEGGLVDRLRRVMQPMPAANKLKTDEDAAKLGSVISETIRILGFNMDFAPVVDVSDQERARYSNGLFSRTFGLSKEDVVKMASAFLTGLHEHQVLGCLKHFPGLAAAQVDSHEELPVVDISEDELDSVDLSPYRALLADTDVDSVMVAHAVFPRHRLQETGQNGKLLPSSLSYGFVTTLLRGELAFDGLVITDDLEMGAIIKNYGIGEACVMAIEAGVDMLAICAGAENIRSGARALTAAVESGRISIERLDISLARIQRQKARISTPLEFDTARLAELSEKIAAFNAYLENN